MTPHFQWDTSERTMAAVRSMIRPIRTDQSLRNVLSEDFPSSSVDMPIGGGWGYTKESAIVFLHDLFPMALQIDIVPIEYHIVRKISYEELIIFQNSEQKFSSIDWQLVNHRRIGDGACLYEALTFEITCWSDFHWEQLKKDWEENDFGRRPGFDLDAHNAKREESRLRYQREFWFDISQVVVTDDHRQSVHALGLPTIGKDEPSVHWTRLLTADGPPMATHNEDIMINDSRNDGVLSVGGIALDASYVGFRRCKVTDNETQQPGLGRSVAYSGGDRGEATIYMYDLGLPEIPDGPLSQVARQEFDRATNDVFARCTDEALQLKLVRQYATGTRDRGQEFLCAELVEGDGLRSWRTFVYLTGAAGKFLKIRLTLRTDDATDPTARNFADAVASHLWKADSDRAWKPEHITGRNVARVWGRRFQVLDLAPIETFGPFLWLIQDVEDPKAIGAIFRCYDETSEQEPAQLWVADVSKDPTEQNIADLTVRSAEEFDKFLESDVRSGIEGSGRRLTEWMSSQLNETPYGKVLVTAYVAEVDGRNLQQIDMRLSIRGRKVVIGGSFEIERASELGRPILDALQRAALHASTFGQTH